MDRCAIPLGVDIVPENSGASAMTLLESLLSQAETRQTETSTNSRVLIAWIAIFSDVAVGLISFTGNWFALCSS